MHLLVALLVVTCVRIAPSDAANILLVPFAHGFNSRLMNMEKIADLLIDGGHNVSLLINSAVEQKVTNRRATWHVFKVPQDVSLSQASDRDFINFMMYGPKDHTGIYAMVQAWLDFEMPLCEALLSDSKMLPQLKAKHFDLLLIDIGDDCSRIIADYLHIPTMLYSNYGFSHDYNLFYPQTLSYVCAPELPDVCTSDDMTFKERMANFVAHFIMEFFTNPYLFDQYDKLRQQHGYNITLRTKDSFNDHVVIANADFAIDFPRPIMPHVVPLSGIFRKDPKPLTGNLLDIFENTNEHGVVVLSFGTLISALDDDQAEIFARVFAKLPHNVIWRHAAKKPKGMGKNTFLLDWIPQNDVLAQRKTRLFITHCGIASTFEAAIHGVPVVTVPLFADQRLNSARLVKRAKMGVQIDIHTLNEIELEDAIWRVLNTTEYHRNARATSMLMHDAPVSPRALLLYWVDYVIRHAGARHLQSGPARRMNWVQYLGLDILGLLLAILLSAVSIVSILLVCLLRFICRSVRDAGKQKQS